MQYIRGGRHSIQAHFDSWLLRQTAASYNRPPERIFMSSSLASTGSRAQTRRPSVAFADYEINDPRSSLSATCILLYGTSHVLIGTVLALSDALSSSKLYPHRLYLEGFLLFEYFLSIMGIIVLQLLVYISEKHDAHRLKMMQEDKEYLKRLNEVVAIEEGEEDPSSGSPKLLEQIRNSFRFNRRSRLKKPLRHTVSDSKDNKNGELSNTNTIEAPQRRRTISEKVMVLPAITVSSAPIVQDETQTKYMSTSMESSDSELKATKSEYDNVISTEKLNSKIVPQKVDDSKDILLELPRSFQFEPIRLATHSHHSCKKILRDKEGVNLYLRLGAVAFGFGVMIYDGFKISDHLNHWKECRSDLWVPKYLTHLTYVFLQTFFIFKFHRILYGWHCTLVRFILIHLATTNVVQWMKTIVYEISEDMRRSNYTISVQPHSGISQHGIGDSVVTTTASSLMSTVYEAMNSTSIHNTTSKSLHSSYLGDSAHHCENGLAEKLSPFLFPCSIEYSLIAGAVCYKMFQKVGMDTSENGGELIKSPVAHAGRYAMTPTGIMKRPSKEELTSQEKLVYSECHRAHRGLFTGLLVIMVTIVALGIFFNFHDKEKGLAIGIYQWTDIILQTFSALACMCAFYQMRVLRFRHLTEGEAFDDNLLLIGVSGMMTYNLFLLLPALEYWNSDDNTASLYAVKSFAEMFQTLLQAFFIVEASRRCAKDQAQIRTKPGRTWVTFLLISNLAMWIVNTFEVKRADQHHQLHKQYYRDFAWSIVTLVSLPLIIFFRFHSTVCLSDIWVKCYKIH